MKPVWGLISDSDEWDRVCHQSKNAVPEDILENAGGFTRVPYNGKKEHEYYEPLCTAVNNLLKLCGDNYTVLTTGFDPESASDPEMKPDICMYAKTLPASAAYTIPPIQVSQRQRKAAHGGIPTATGLDGDGGTIPSDDSIPLTSDHIEDSPCENAEEQATEIRKPFQARTAWAWMTALVEVKHQKHWAPYRIDKDGKLLLINIKSAKETRVQIAKYAAEALLRQHRKFFFCAVLVNRTAYLMRWDRTGVLVTAPFDYIEEPRKLFRFFYRIATADPSLQGYDPTVTLASDDEVKALKEHYDSLPRDSTYLRDCVHRSLANIKLYPIQKVTCSNPSEPQQHSDNGREVDATQASGTAVTLSSSASNPSPPNEAASRISHRETSSWFTLTDWPWRKRDYWYADHPMVHPETEVYRKLARATVRNVATLVAGGDVADSSGCQETLTQEHLTSELMPAKRRHHRLVVAEIGRPLESYKDGRELVQVLYDALSAHRDAWEKAEILHRDISSSNILIDIATGKAFLNDWDLCKYKCELNQEVSRHARSGTWPYMSATLVEFPRKPNELADDIESFLHTFTINILRFHLHTLSAKRVGAPTGRLEGHLHIMYFGSELSADGYCVGLQTKLRVMTSGQPDFKVKSSPMLSTLLTRLYELGRDHYAMLDLDQLEEDWGEGAVTTQPSLHVGDLQKGFNTHRLFLDIMSTVLHDPKFQSTLDEKTPDQFQYISPLVPDVASGRSNKRPSEESGRSSTGSVTKKPKVTPNAERSLATVSEV